MTATVARKAPSEQRQRGAYYTPADAAEFMADWLVRSAGETYVEPSFGAGAFLRAVTTAATKKELGQPCIRGFELDKDAIEAALAEELIRPDMVVHGDFLGQHAFPATGVIGNPPYVRLRDLQTEAEKSRAIEVSQELIPGGMETSGSVWMPFVLHASRFIAVGGRMALVLPYEITHVRYARPLWTFLGAHFSSVRVIRVFERVFPEILQDVVILLADGHGGSTEQVRYEVYQSVSELIRCHP